jgi:hypothetical protein
MDLVVFISSPYIPCLAQIGSKMVCWGSPSLLKVLRMKELFATKGTECRSCNRHAQNAEGLELRLKMVTKIRRGSELARKRPIYP